MAGNCSGIERSITKPVLISSLQQKMHGDGTIHSTSARSEREASVSGPTFSGVCFRQKKPHVDSVGTSSVNRIFRRIPSELLDDLPESLVDPVEGELDGLVQVTKSDCEATSPCVSPQTEGIGHGVTGTRSGTPVTGRAITVIGSPVKKPGQSQTPPNRPFTNIGCEAQEETKTGQYVTQHADYLTPPRKSGNHQNSGSQSLRCQECSGGTVFGVYHTPKGNRKTYPPPAGVESHRKVSTSPPTSARPPPVQQKKTVHQANSDANVRWKSENRYKPVYFSDPRYRRLERYNYGGNLSSKEIAVTGLQDFCRTMLSVKNVPVDYQSTKHHQIPKVTSVSSENRRGAYVAYENGGHAERTKPNENGERHFDVGNGRTDSSHRNAKDQNSQKQSKCSPTLRSPKLVKEVLKRMASHPSGKIPESAADVSDDENEEFVDDRLPNNRVKKTGDIEAMKVINEIDKNLAAECSPKFREMPRDKIATAENIQLQDRKSLPLYHHEVASNSSRPHGKEQEVQSDNLIEEMVLSGPKQKLRLEQVSADIHKDSPTVSAGEGNLNVNGSSANDLQDEEKSSGGDTSPAPPKPPRNYDSLPRGFKPNMDQATLDMVSSGVHPLTNGSLDGVIKPSNNSTDSGVCSPQQSYFVVVAIDFGTTYSGYAFSLTRDSDNIHMMRKWEGGDPGVVNQKTPTTLLLTPEEKFHSFGYSARDHYHDLDSQDAKRWLYFEKFKMTLHKTEHLNRDTVIKAANGKTVPAVTVFAHALRYFKEHAIQELSDQSATNITNDDIRWVVTVPAIWRQPAKQFMRTAAYEAGIASADLPEQLLIALEPEAASIYCRRLRMHQLVPAVPVPQRLSLPNIKEPVEGSLEPAVVESLGTRYMVVDCGGGTVDITLHEIADEQGTIKELHKATGGPYGSVGIDIEFEKLLNEIFGADFMEQFKTKRPAAFVDLMIAFEARKRNSSPYKITPLNISLPFSFIDYYKKTKSNSVENAIKKYGNKEIKWSSQGMLRLEPVCMMRLFQPTLDAIRAHISSVLDKPGVQNIGYLFLVGGFAESQILQKNIRDAFSNRVKVIIPQGVSLAILKGAVLFGLDPTVVNARRSRLTYGVGVLNRFVHGVHPKDKLVVKDGVEWCADVFDKFVVSDQSVSVGDMVIRKYTPARVGQACSVIHIYCSERDDAAFITDRGVQRCGTLILDLSDTKYSPPSSPSGRREIQTVMIFGDTELKVSAMDVSTGRCVKAEVDFFNH